MKEFIQPIPVKERNDVDLLELVCELHSRTLSYPSEKTHNAWLEAKNEMEKRLAGYNAASKDSSGEVKEEKISEVLTNVLYSISGSNGHHLFDTDKCDEIASFMIHDLKKEGLLAASQIGSGDENEYVEYCDVCGKFDRCGEYQQEGSCCSIRRVKIAASSIPSLDEASQPEINRDYQRGVVDGLKQAGDVQRQSYPRWVNLEDILPIADQKVDLWLVPSDGKSAYRMPWTWEKYDTARIKINGHKVTHWMPQPMHPEETPSSIQEHK